jgi:hypothetical protein
VVKEVCFAIKADPLQVRREGDNANVIFLKEWSRVFKSSYRIRFIQKYRRYL